jgi:hypothetical protein
MLSVLEFNLTVPTSHRFSQRYCKLAQASDVQEACVQYLCESALQEYKMLKFLPSQIGAAAVYLTRHYTKQQPWVCQATSLHVTSLHFTSLHFTSLHFALLFAVCWFGLVCNHSNAVVCVCVFVCCTHRRRCWPHTASSQSTTRTSKTAFESCTPSPPTPNRSTWLCAANSVRRSSCVCPPTSNRCRCRSIKKTQATSASPSAHARTPQRCMCTFGCAHM